MCFRDIIFQFGSELSSVWSSILIHWQDSGILIIHDFCFCFRVSIFSNYYLIKSGDGGDIWKKNTSLVLIGSLDQQALALLNGSGLTWWISTKDWLRRRSYMLFQNIFFIVMLTNQVESLHFTGTLCCWSFLEKKLIKQTISLSTVINKS